MCHLHKEVVWEVPKQSSLKTSHMSDNRDENMSNQHPQCGSHIPNGPKTDSHGDQDSTYSQHGHCTWIGRQGSPQHCFLGKFCIFPNQVDPTPLPERLDQKNDVFAFQAILSIFFSCLITFMDSCKANSVLEKNHKKTSWDRIPSITKNRFLELPFGCRLILIARQQG